MRCKKVYDIALMIDKNKSMNRNSIIKLLSKFNPEFIGKGGFKRAFKIKVNSKYYVFKVCRTSKECIENLEQYELSLGKHKMKYAKIYWITKYCMLQRYCVTNNDYSIEELKIAWKNKGYVDVRKANVGLYKNKLVAFDVIKSKRSKNE